MSKTISIVLVIGLIIGVLIYFLPSSKIDKEYLNKIDSLNTHISTLEKKQDSLNQDIKSYKTQITEVDDHIQTIKNQKTVVKEYYHEKIISVDGFSRSDIDTFFANRYGYNH
jgi:hypothetical protein